MPYTYTEINELRAAVKVEIIGEMQLAGNIGVTEAYIDPTAVEERVRTYMAADVKPSDVTQPNAAVSRLITTPQTT